MATGFKFDVEGAYIEKDPNAKKDYQIDFSKWLAVGETIVSAVWTVAAGLNKVSEAVAATSVTIELSGGTVDKNYLVNAHIVTSTGREDDKSFRVVIRQQ